MMMNVFNIQKTLITLNQLKKTKNNKPTIFQQLLPWFRNVSVAMDKSLNLVSDITETTAILINSSKGIHTAPCVCQVVCHIASDTPIIFRLHVSN